jgi:UDP-3-O-[3-hydroxymyristoyl] N-acetylglucosamine deacetylase
MFDIGASQAVIRLPEMETEHRSFPRHLFPASLVSQRTLKSAISCTGIGLHSGSKISMTLRPAEPDTGILFRRTDIAGGGALIAARWDRVSDTRLNTCVADANGVGVRTIEHLLAALAGMNIDNLLIDINGPEVPVMDGSAAPFLFLMECAGVVEQAVPRQALKILKTVIVRDGEKCAMLSPAAGFSVQVEIDFPVAAIRRQACRVAGGGNAFKSELSRARTFGFEQEAAALRAAGLGRGGSLDNAVVISSDGSRVLNEDGLRYEDEFVRHKALAPPSSAPSTASAPVMGSTTACCASCSPTVAPGNG